MDKGGRHYDDDVHGLACRTRTSENKPNTRSEQIDGWMGGWMEGKGREHRAQQTAPRKKLRSPNPGSIYYIHAGPETAKMDAPLSLEYRVQGATTHKKLTMYTQYKRAHTRTQSHNPAGVRPTCNQRTGPVQRHTRPFLCCSIDCRCKIHVNKRQWVVPRIFVSGACTCTGLVLADR